MELKPADLRIDVACLVSMSRRGQRLAAHSLLVRDGRVLDVLPTTLAGERYQAAVLVERPSHVLLPGLINGHAEAALSLLHRVEARNAERTARLSSDFAYDSVRVGVAAMLKSGTTCFVDRSFFPADAARAVHDQGLRAVIGLPVAESASPWAETAAEYLSRALELRDEYRAHPLISTAFAPLRANELNDAVLTRLGMLANELDAGITLDLHASAREIADSEARHGTRPLERWARLGLLSPALHAVHMSEVSRADIELAQRSGIAVCACPHSSVRAGNGLPPLGAFLDAGLRVGLGSAGATTLSYDLWGELKLAAAMLDAAQPDAEHRVWDALALSTCAAAAALGLDSEVGTLQPGKWADLCCVDVSAPTAGLSADPLEAALYGGSVTDVWVAGRPLLSNGELTRLDWSALQAKAQSWSAMMAKAG
jgi:5-methylthioadenosine/S-adenosylhomocysteine deaminase